MSMNRWDHPNVPHKEWRCVNITDLGEPIHTCEMCGQEQIRYVHTMEHDDHDNLDVGCVCAEKMTDDYINPKLREARLKNRAARRMKWLRRKWRVSAKGNLFLNTGGRNVGVRFDKTARKWSYWIKEEWLGTSFSGASFNTSQEAKLALFDDLWHLENP